MLIEIISIFIGTTIAILVINGFINKDWECFANWEYGSLSALLGLALIYYV